MKRVVFAVVVLCGLSSIARAGLDEGMTAFKQGDYEVAFRILKPFAEQGNAEVQSALGLMYARGTGVLQDLDKAFTWFQKAALQGDSSGQFGLGYMFGKGISVPQDYVKAAKWLHKAAEQGHSQAQFSLGLLYGMGGGMPRDDVKALMWLNLAAEQRVEQAAATRDQIARDMAPVDVAKGRSLFLDWLESHEKR